MSYSLDTRLLDLPLDMALEFGRPGRPLILTTPRQLIREGRISGSLSLGEVETVLGPVISVTPVA